MNIIGRIRRLEATGVHSLHAIAAGGLSEMSTDELVRLKQNRCTHSGAAMHFYRVRPPMGYRTRELITKGHCNACAFDDYIFAFLNLTPEQEARRWELRDTSGGWRADQAYLLELIDAGLIDFVPFPPPPEIEEAFTTNIRR
jgi:hypothetical protein